MRPARRLPRRRSHQAGCWGKRRYPDHRSACAAITLAQPHDNGRKIPTRCYECAACHGWHLTSQDER